MDIAEALRDARNETRASLKPHGGPDGQQVYLVPEGYEVKQIQQEDRPIVRIVQTPIFHDMASFNDYVGKFKAETTRYFAEPGFLAGGQPKVIAYFDYHDVGKPAHLAHKAVYALRYSDPWLRWTGASKKAMKQAEFAEFIEENRLDIVEPTATQLLDLVKVFRATKKADFNSAVYQNNGKYALDIGNIAADKAAVTGRRAPSKGGRHG